MPDPEDDVIAPATELPPEKTEDSIERVSDAVSEEEAVSDPSAPKRKRLSEATWLQIEHAINYDTKTTQELMDEFGITGSAISMRIQRAKDKGRVVKRGSLKHLLKPPPAPTVPAAPPTPPSNFESKKVQRIESTKETLFRHSANNQAILMQIQKDIADGKRTPSDCTGDLKALRHAEALIKTMSENRWKLLSIDKVIDEETMPKLQFEDLSDQEIAEIQKNAGAGEDDDDDIEMPVLEEDDAV